MRSHWPLIFLLIIVNLTTCARAESDADDGAVPVIDVRTVYQDAVVGQMAFLAEQEEALSVDEVQSLIRGNPTVLKYPESSVLTRGINSGAIWLVANVLNPTDDTIFRRVSVRTGWLEHVDFFFITEGRLPQHFIGGDRIPLNERSLAKRIPSADYPFPPGETRLLLRIETADPMVVPLYFSSIAASHSREQSETAFYSFVYGVMFALSACSLMLFAGLRQRRYLLYSLYTGSFVATTASYNGIGMALLWPEAVGWQQWAPPLLMLCFASSGLAFATNFLNIKRCQPRFHRTLQTISVAYFALFAACFALDEQGLALRLAFLVVPVFSVLMVYMGVSSWVAGNQSARYFMLGTLASVVGASITASTVTGMIPYTQLGYYAVDIGMVVDAILLMLALADLVRKNEEARTAAEQNAQTDLLTGLNNRRGFLPVAESLWSLVTRKNRNVCVAMIDIDRFKNINDQYGHAVGDKVLKAVADELDRSRRRGDLLARWGGEEFTLLLPETSEAEALKVAERFRHNIEQLVTNDRGRLIQCTISIGVTSRHAEHVTLDQAIARADEELYRAKLQGRNQVSFGRMSGLSS
ncbi:MULTISPECIES: diguanylate cyclase [unclassified Marinobacter]|uniref:diguanylate cyclase n=1 Tax=unclassified Marinobacter TaxID=83889 RepID=UPI00201081A0|nr:MULTISPECIES: diguanylate cyclase [unclassified Marinobacter]UQG55871.1 sensor domain-containing diguanylate cyclase [Marinobacter sp. M4C]UQG64675.1 sensor domain-containing diguanylate cyclase [Marinobacter sp. M2C]UQG68954.1 sensor domain-containing diguanylate cyclase [Marinobacter sp. M1C]